MTQLGKGISDAVVNDAFADLSAFDVDHRNPQRERDRSRRQHLITIRDDEKQIRPHPSQAICKSQNRYADRFCHPHVGI